jgi:hypothetical protein
MNTKITEILEAEQKTMEEALTPHPGDYHAVTILVSLAWWLKPYLACLTFICKLKGCEPDMDKLRATVKTAIRLHPVA